MFERDNKMNDDVMLNKLYNMIKTSLSLNTIENRTELLRNFEKVAKDIDKQKQKLYLEEVQEKFYKTTNLEDERKRLSSLIVCIAQRLDERNRLLQDYYNVTNRPLEGLEEIIYTNNLNEFKERSNTICTYLENEEEIGNIKKELEFLSTQLEKERDIKRNCEVVNAKLEEKLLNNFKNVIAGNKYYTSFSSKDIDEEIRKIAKEIVEKEEKVNAFVLAYESIKNERISSRDELEEYASYVLKIKEMYYECTKKYTFLQIYKLVMKPMISTEEIYKKRILIKKLLDDLNEIKLKLKIEEPNLLFDFYMLVKEQDVKVINSVDNMKRIKQIEDKIDYFNEKIVRLESEQETPSIISILKEYGLINDLKEELNINFDGFDNYSKTATQEPIYDDSKIKSNVEGSKTFDFNFDLGDLSVLNEELNKDEAIVPQINSINYYDNAIKEVKELPFTMNIGLVTKKANSVINKVSSRLGINYSTSVKNQRENLNINTATNNMDTIISNNNHIGEAVINLDNEINKVNTVLENNINNDGLDINDKEDPNHEERNEQEEQPVQMPDFDFTTFWDEITDNSNGANTNNSNGMPNLPI